jgi:beta-glucosidase
VSQRTDGFAEAVACAQAADVAIVCVGDLAGLFQTGTVSEGSDTDSLALPGVQQQLLEHIVATGTPTVVVLMAGRPYHLGGLESRVAAYLMAFAGGQEGGTAIAEVLAGLQEPSGRMPVSVPTSAGAMPYFYNHSLKSGGTPIALHFGSRYPFGFGLAYTPFAYRNLVLESDAVDLADGDIRVQCEVANTGSRPGVAVVQLYVRDRLASVVRPVKELKAFQRVALAPGQVARLDFTVPVDMLCFTHPQLGQRCVEPGWFDVMVGPSSADTPLTTAVQVLGTAPRVLGRDWRMQSSCYKLNSY